MSSDTPATLCATRPAQDDRDNNNNKPASTLDDDEAMPWLSRMLHHVLTPGSSLTPIVWLAFNVIMLGLLLVWLLFVVAMPRNVHVWVFGLLGAGLAVSTNWLMRLVFHAGLDYASQQQQEQEERQQSAHDGMHTSSSSAASKQKAKAA